MPFNALRAVGFWTLLAVGARCRHRATGRRERRHASCRGGQEPGHEGGPRAAVPRRCECRRTRWRHRIALGGPLERHRGGGCADQSRRERECGQRSRRHAAAGGLRRRRRDDGRHAAEGGREPQPRASQWRIAPDVGRPHRTSGVGEGTAGTGRRRQRARVLQRPDRADVGDRRTTQRGRAAAHRRPRRRPCALGRPHARGFRRRQPKRNRPQRRRRAAIQPRVRGRRIHGPAVCGAAGRCRIRDAAARGRRRRERHRADRHERARGRRPQQQRERRHAAPREGRRPQRRPGGVYGASCRGAQRQPDDGQERCSRAARIPTPG